MRFRPDSSEPGAGHDSPGFVEPLFVAEPRMDPRAAPAQRGAHEWLRDRVKVVVSEHEMVESAVEVDVKAGGKVVRVTSIDAVAAEILILGRGRYLGRKAALGGWQAVPEGIGPKLVPGRHDDVGSEGP